MSDKLSPLGEAALAYVRRGLRVLPLKEGTKIPDLKDWVNKAFSEEAEVRGWWEKNPDANIGCATGADSSVIVLDVDVRPNRDGRKTIEEWEGRHGKLPPVPKCITPSGGYHLYFRWVPDVETRHNLGNGVDLQAENVQVVLPPSVVDNRVYRWDNQEGLALLGAEPPSWLRWMQLPQAGPSSSYAVESARTYAHVKLYETHWEGCRHNAIFKYCCTLRGISNCDDNQVLIGGLGYNQRYCEPPYADWEVEYIAASVCKKYPRGNHDTLDGIKPDLVDENGERTKPGKSMSVIRNTEYPPCRWFVERMLPEGVTIVHGPPKIGKSFWVMQLVKALMEGGYFLGYRVEPATVYYLALEDGEGRFSRRMEAQGWPQYPERGDFIEGSGFMQRYGPLDKGGINTLIDDMKAFKWDVVIIDTLSKAWGIDQNDVAETTQALMDLQRYCNEYHAAVIIVDHDRKSGLGGDHILNIGGSRGKPASADTIISISDKDSVTQVAKLQVTGREAEPLTMSIKWRNADVQWEPIEGVEAPKNDHNLILMAIRELEGQGKRRIDEDIIRYLVDGGHKYLSKDKPCKDSKIGSLIKNLKRSKDIGYDSDGNLFVVEDRLPSGDDDDA